MNYVLNLNSASTFKSSVNWDIQILAIVLCGPNNLKVIIIFWKDVIYRLDDGLLKVHVDGVGRVFKQLLQLEEGIVVGVRLLIWQKHIGTWIYFADRTSAVTKHSI